MQVAIDGPAGSGKSTVSKLLAKSLKFIYLDTGAMYRASAWLKQQYKLNFNGLCALLSLTDFVFGHNGQTLTLKYDYGKPTEVDVTKLIRTPDVTAIVSGVASNVDVRTILTTKQQEIAGKNDIIMDGRDIGTVVLPNADVKIFLTASAEVRARRRMSEWRDVGQEVHYEDVLADIIVRDNKDASRSTAPLKKADDAYEIDTSELTIFEVSERIEELVRARI
ncbi:(d)CMP kinase [Deferribacterales bacterium RsTz2092]|nr:cytidylate kinase [Deferribacterales bacterium]